MFRDSLLRDNLLIINKVLSLLAQSNNVSRLYCGLRSIYNYEELCKMSLIEYSDDHVLFLLIKSVGDGDSKSVLDLLDDGAKERMSNVSENGYLRDLVRLCLASSEGKYRIYQSGISQDGMDLKRRYEELESLLEGGVFCTRYFVDRFENRALANISEEISKIEV